MMQIIWCLYDQHASCICHMDWYYESLKVKSVPTCFTQIYFVSSGLSFYFIYDFCLYDGMSALVSYLLRYLPLGVAFIICSTVLVIR